MVVVEGSTVEGGVSEAMMAAASIVAESEGCEGVL